MVLQLFSFHLSHMAADHAKVIEEEVKILAREIRERLGKKQPDGSYTVTFGIIF